MFIVQNNNKHGTKHITFIQVLGVFFSYICFFPLAYFSAYFVFILGMLVIGTPIDSSFVALIKLTLNIKESKFSIDINDVKKMFLIWWLIIGSLFQIISKITKVKLKKRNLFLAFAGVLFLANIFLVTKFGLDGVWVLLILYCVALACLAMYMAPFSE